MSNPQTALRTRRRRHRPRHNTAAGRAPSQGGGRRLGALTSYGRNTLADLADVTLRVSTREKLVEKLGCYGMSVSTLLLLDIIYSCVLALDYERNAVQRVRMTRDFEQFRDSSNPILHDRRA